MIDEVMGQAVKMISILIYQDAGLGFELVLISLMFLAIFIPIIVVSWGYTPNKYILAGQELIISRPFSNIPVLYAEINDVELRVNFSLFKQRRLWGNSGLLGLQEPSRTRSLELSTSTQRITTV